MIRLETRSTDGLRETRSFACELRAEGDQGIVAGYGSVFDVRDSYGDVIKPGAFAKTLEQHRKAKTLPAMLWQHDGSQPIGVWDEVEEDAKGLRIKGRLAMNTTRGREAYELMKMQAINGLSIGFVATEKSFNDKDGTRTLTGIDLWEVSLVTFPANAKSRVTSIKAAGEMPAPKDAERILRDAGFSKSDATAFVSRVMRMGEERREAAQAAATTLRSASRLLASLNIPQET
jgi:uncharacterized protein